MAGAKSARGIKAYWDNLTPEGKKEFLDRRSAKIREAKEKRDEVKERQRELEKRKELILLEKIGPPSTQIVTRKIKEELFKMTDNKDYIPRWEILNAAINLCRDGKDLEAIRTQFFSEIQQDIWAKFKKSLFAIQISSSEDVGNELLMARDRATSEIRKEIEKMRVLQKDRPQLFHQPIIRALTQIQAIESDTAKRLVDVGAVGNKRTGGISVQIVNYIPRPDKPLAHDKKVNTNYITTAPVELDYDNDKKIIEISKDEKIKA